MHATSWMNLENLLSERKQSQSPNIASLNFNEISRGRGEGINIGNGVSFWDDENNVELVVLVA